MTDDSFYAQVATEISEERIDRTTWTKAFAQSGGADAATMSLYIRFRVEQLRAEFVNALQFFRERQAGLVAQAKSDAQAGKTVKCPQCGNCGKAQRKERGDIATFFGLCLLGLLPGIIYYFTNGGFRYECWKCGSVFYTSLDK